MTETTGRTARHPLRERLDLLCRRAPLVPGLWLLGRAHRATVLSALEDAADYRRDQGDFCLGCGVVPDGRKCEDHANDDSAARMYDDLGTRLQGESRRVLVRWPA